MRVHHGLIFAVPTLNRYEGLVRLLDSVAAGTVVPEKYLVIDNGGKFGPWLQEAKDRGATWASPAFKLHTPESNLGERNLGVAASWNVALGEQFAWTLIAGDDCVFSPTTVERLMRAAADYPEAGFYSPTIEDSSGWQSEWSCFMQTGALTKRIGLYDEIFYPGWFEDNDYRRRMELTGLRAFKVRDSLIRHEAGSTSGQAILADEDGRPRSYRERWDMNERRYVEKWGGVPGKETVTIPRAPIRR